MKRLLFTVTVAVIVAAGSAFFSRVYNVQRSRPHAADGYDLIKTNVVIRGNWIVDGIDDTNIEILGTRTGTIRAAVVTTVLVTNYYESLESAFSNAQNGDMIYPGRGGHYWRSFHLNE